MKAPVSIHSVYFGGGNPASFSFYPFISARSKGGDTAAFIMLVGALLACGLLYLMASSLTFTSSGGFLLSVLVQPSLLRSKRHPMDCGCALARRAQGGPPCVLFPVERERKRVRQCLKGESGTPRTGGAAPALVERERERERGVGTAHSPSPKQSKARER